MEFWGWMVFPLGLPYTLWRMLCKIPVCGECRHPTLIPLDSAVGQKLLAKFNEEMGVLPVKQVLPPMPVAVVPSGPRPVVDPEAW